MTNQPGKPGIAPLIATDDEMPPRGVFDDAPHDDQESSEAYDGFTQSPLPDDTVVDAAGRPFSLDESALAGSTVPASDRYVSVRDNQPAFENLISSLNQVRDEFAKDHNKGTYAALAGIEELKSEIEATLAQARQGRVRKSQLTDGLLPALAIVAAAANTYPGLKEMVRDAIFAVQMILAWLGIT